VDRRHGPRCPITGARRGRWTVGLVYVGPPPPQHPGACTANFMRYDANAMENRTALACASPARTPCTVSRSRRAVAVSTRARARSSGRCTQGERRACPVPGPRYAGKRRMALARLPRRAQLHLHPRARCRVGYSLGPDAGGGTAVGRHTRLQGTHDLDRLRAFLASPDGGGCACGVPIAPSVTVHAHQLRPAVRGGGADCSEVISFKFYAIKLKDRIDLEYDSTSIIFN
jgi:hypothetical protein